MDLNVWTIIFFVLACVALLTQTERAKSVTYVVRGPVKAAPAFFLAAVSWYLNGPLLLTLAFFLCACGDILLDMAKATFAWAFEAGVVVFSAALICLSIVYLSKPLSGRPLLLLTLPNIVLAVFVCVWVLPKIKRPLRIPAVAYLSLLVASNIIAATSLVPVFLGSTLWLISDLAIAVSRHIPGTPANGLTNLGLYDLGLFFIALGFLNS
jgi:YhhN family